MIFLKFLAAFCFFKAINGCALPTGRATWSIDIPSNENSLLSRRTRDVSLNERMDCAPGDTPPSTREDTTQRVDALIELMKKEGFQAYIIPTSDEHLSEYVSEYDNRRHYISGFKGSAGTAVVLANGQRALWTDGRYYLESDIQMDCNWLLMKEEEAGVPTIVEWLASSLQTGDVVGADAKLISSEEWMKYDKILKESGISILASKTNFIDDIWPAEGRSAATKGALEILDLKFAGKDWRAKVADVRTKMKEMDVDLFVVTALDEVAWLLNLRGKDHPNHPIFRGYIIIEKDSLKFFTEKSRITPDIDYHLTAKDPCPPNCFEFGTYESVFDTVKGLSSKKEVKRVLLPAKLAYSGGSSYAIFSAVPEEKRYQVVSPILYMKATKNPTEIEGMKNSHRRDSVALIEFLSLLEEEIKAGKEWDEIGAAKKLTEMRAEKDNSAGDSFKTISAFGSNGAIIHYKPNEVTNKKITTESTYLLDSGGQYKDGTTDVTRTMHYGTPTEFQKETYTRVLMGSIDVATAVFPKSTKDTRLDILARRPLLDVGLNYRHGTGHGIGMYLFIHESPTQMRLYAKEEHAMEEGYFFSDEPGYYEEGEFGIRLETIMRVVKKNTTYTSYGQMYGFEAVTLVPFEPNMIDYSLLSKSQCEYLNYYNQRIKDEVGPELKSGERAHKWMMQRTEPLTCNQSGENFEPNSSLTSQTAEQKQKLKEDDKGAGSRIGLNIVYLVIPILLSFRR